MACSEDRPWSPLTRMKTSSVSLVAGDFILFRQLVEQHRCPVIVEKVTLDIRHERKVVHRLASRVESVDTILFVLPPGEVLIPYEQTFPRL